MAIQEKTPVGAETRIDEAKLNAFLAKVLGDWGAVSSAPLVMIGDRLGLYDAMAAAGPVTSEELARRTGTDERYVREWLGAMVTGRIIEYDPATRTYWLPREHAALLTRAAGPDNLAELAQVVAVLGQVESAWSPIARSWAAAVGLWQFIPSTGLRYGLRQDYWVDERQSFEKATRASARYLKWLADRYAGNWELAMAAYNSGEGRVDGAIARSGYADFWEIYNRGLLPNETRNYVQRVIEARNMYRLRLADGNVARIPFLQVAGPIRPTPMPHLKPQDAARAVRYTVITARAPLPRLKPVVETSLDPDTGRVTSVYPAPEAPALT